MLMYELLSILGTAIGLKSFPFAKKYFWAWNALYFKHLFDTPFYFDTVMVIIQ